MGGVGDARLHHRADCFAVAVRAPAGTHDSLRRSALAGVNGRLHRRGAALRAGSLGVEQWGRKV